MKSSKYFLIRFWIDIKKVWNNLWRTVVLCLIMLRQCITSHKISLRRDGLYIDSPEWAKIKESTINTKTNDNICFQYAVTVAINNDNILKHPEIIVNIRPFKIQYDWEEKHSNRKTLKQTINQLFSMFCSHHTIEKK